MGLRRMQQPGIVLCVESCVMCGVARPLCVSLVNCLSKVHDSYLLAGVQLVFEKGLWPDLSLSTQCWAVRVPV